MKMKTTKLCWNVCIHEFNRDEFTYYNVLTEQLVKQLAKFKKQCKNIQEFNDFLKKEMQYYYWSRTEWEIIICPWGGKKDLRVKVDAFDQLLMNWDIFLNYVWDNI